MQSSSILVLIMTLSYMSIKISNKTHDNKVL